MNPHAPLAALATAAEYPPATLSLIAEATLARYHAGEPLDDTALGHVASAVEVLIEAGISAARLPQLVQRYQRADGARWRDSFWAHALRTASAREHQAPSRRATPPARDARVAARRLRARPPPDLAGKETNP